MELNVYNHYKNALAVQFGMTIAGDPRLGDAYDGEAEEVDELFDKWVQEFDASDADDSWEFFEERITGWIEDHSDGQATVSLAENSLKPGDHFYAVVFEKKLNAAHRYVTTKNRAVKNLCCTEIRVADPDPAVVVGYDWNESGGPSYEVAVNDCFTCWNAADHALRKKKA